MTNDKYEELSALLDNELDPEKIDVILDSMKGDQTLLGSWDRYSLIGDAIRGEAVRYSATGISPRVRDAIADEPAIVSFPQKKSRSANHTTPSQISWLRPIVGMALAASVAVMAVYVSPLINQSPIGDAGELASTTATPALVMPAGHRWKNLNEPGVASKLDEYLREHSEFSTPGGMGGVLPYTSFVSYDNTRR